MNIPVIIFQQGYQEYLEVNCKLTSAKNEVILLGDDSVKHLDKINNVNFVNIEKYIKNQEILYYKENFTPYNTTPEKYVWLWYLRVFVMKLFMEDYGLTSIFHSDSDNILTQNISKLNFDFENGYIINNNKIPTHMTSSIHCGYLSFNFFNEFTKLYQDLFINKTKFNLIEKKIQFHNIHGKGGICDMTLFYLLHSEGILNVKNFLQPIKSKLNNDEYFFMDNFADCEGDLGLNQIKLGYNKNVKLYKNKHNGNLQVFDKIRNKKINILNIHFQGKSKKYLNEKFLEKYL